MASPEDVLRAKAVSILRSKACLDIKFSVAGMTLMAYGYGYVADMLAQDVIKVAIGATGVFTAAYDSAHNRITFGTKDPVDLATADGRGTVVHECTHALIDAIRKGRSVAYGDNEVAAYIAQTVYAMNAGDRFNTISPVAGPVFSIASKIRNYRGEGVYTVDPADVVSVRAQILAIYQAVAKSQSKIVPIATVMDGIDP